MSTYDLPAPTEPPPSRFRTDHYQAWATRADTWATSIGKDQT